MGLGCGRDARVSTAALVAGCMGLVRVKRGAWGWSAVMKTSFLVLTGPVRGRT